MRGLQISLNQTQKIRLQSALESLESISLKANSDASVIVADTIPVNYEDGILKYIISSTSLYWRYLDCINVSLNNYV